MNLQCKGFIRPLSEIVIFLFQIDITRPDTDRFIVTVEGVRGIDFTGDIALDDIMIFSGYCPQSKFVLFPFNTQSQMSANG